jgi:ubiquitin C-terminal hydrolase
MKITTTTILIAAILFAAGCSKTSRMVNNVVTEREFNSILQICKDQPHSTGLGECIESYYKPKRLEQCSAYKLTEEECKALELAVADRMRDFMKAKYDLR